MNSLLSVVFEDEIFPVLNFEEPAEGKARELVRQEALEPLLRIRKEIEICRQKLLMSLGTEDSAEIRAFDEAYERLLLETARESFVLGFRAGLAET